MHSYLKNSVGPYLYRGPGKGFGTISLFKNTGKRHIHLITLSQWSLVAFSKDPFFYEHSRALCVAQWLFAVTSPKKGSGDFSLIVIVIVI